MNAFKMFLFLVPWYVLADNNPTELLNRKMNINVAARGSLKETVVNIGGNVKVLNTSTTCSAGSWGNNLENSCQCCLVKHLFNDFNPTKAIDY
jgi:hypothetical protein